MFLAITSVAAASLTALLQAKIKIKRMSILSGQCWVEELLAGHPDQIKEQLRMSKVTFHWLLDKESDGTPLSKFW